MFLVKYSTKSNAKPTSVLPPRSITDLKGTKSDDLVQSTPADDEVVKTYPWVPVLSREGFDAQLARVRKLLDGLPRPAGVFLNDLQAAPSACGCGHSFTVK